MIKKHKNSIISIIASIIFVAVIFVTIGNVYSEYNPTESEFMQASASSLLGKDLKYEGTLWNTLLNAGKLTCFAHKSGSLQNRMNTSIHSVFDIGFDEEKGVIKVESIINDGTNNVSPMISYANGSNTSIGNLAAQSSRSNNAKIVQHALVKAIKEGTVVNEATVCNELVWENPDKKISVTNPASQDEVNMYNNYQKIKGQDINAKEIEEEIQINQKAYTLMGPFQMTFRGKPITEITVGNATWNASKTDEIYWATSATQDASWSSEFNKATSANYELNGRQFYLAVETSKLPEDGSYNVNVKQEAFQYYNSRIIVCDGNFLQESGMYLYDNTPHTVQGEASWTLKRRSLKTLIISKTDERTNKAITGAGFKLYAELNNGTKGWVSGNAQDSKTYGDAGTEYAAKTEIKNLKYGTYYVYETKGADNYDLSEQKGYHQKAAGSDSLSGDWVYLGSQVLKTGTGDKITFNAKNRALLSLTIAKTDEKTNNEITGSGFKIYAELNNGTKGWVSGSAQGSKTYGSAATEYEAKTEIKKLKYGTYYIYETKAAEDYDLSEQKGYHQKAAGSDSLEGDWVYLGSKVLDKDTGASITFGAKNQALATLKIIKKDQTKGFELSGAKFKIYAVLNNGTKGWVSGDIKAKKTYGSNATEYDSATEISKLKYGTYYIYETKTPEGYDITKQDGYHKAAEGSSGLTGDWAFLGTQKLDVNSPDDGVFKFEAQNKKIVDALEGDVWVDEPDTKGNKTDNVYNSASKDYLKAGITVNLYDGKNNKIATTTTDANGHYKFTQKTSGTDKNIYYWDLVDAYVEFIYNNKTTYNNDGTVKEYGFITVDPFVGNDAKINSKAQEETVTVSKLNDNNLTGTTGENAGRAITNKNVIKLDVDQLLSKNKEISDKIKQNNAKEDDLKDIPLACYYDNTTYKVSNINLGLLEQYDAKYDVDETLAYIKIRMKGYTYTYKYGDSAATTSTNVPTVNEQNSRRTFTGSIYPTDIAYNVANQTDELKVYVVYSVDVKNLETMYVDNKYTEQRLYLESLVNTYDTSRYELCSNENNEDKADFALWTKTQDGKASYDVNNANSVYRNGLAKQETKRSYIQFRVKEEALEKILTKTLKEEDIEKAPTVATARAYHEYLRTDNAWEHNDNVRAFEGAKGTSIYPVKNDAGKKYYVHKTISKNISSSDLYLILTLGDSRKISGTVFQDTRTSQSEKDNTNLGNGIMDDNETNRAQDVIVELLDADKKTVSKLYQNSNGKIVYKQDGSLPDAKTVTAVGGTYTFDGVVPGYYYVRFTYGDGTQKIMPAGTQIKSNDYKSTIINTETTGAGDIIKNAMEAKANDVDAIRAIVPTNQNDSQKRIVEWYKYLNGNKYSTATDNLTQRLEIDGYKYEDGKVYDKDGKEVTDLPRNINAYTPMVSISIENDINVSTDEGNAHKSNYDGFNFGLIEQPDTTILLEKKITNVKLTTQTGSTLVSANPADQTSQYLTALDKITGGTKYAKLEIDKSLIYGSELATTYEITLTNSSTKDYIENEGSDNFGHYYYYGEITETTKQKSVVVNEVVDELDAKYNYDTKQESVIATVKKTDGNEEQKEVSIVKKNSDGSTEKTNRLSITGWKEFESGETESLNYTVTSLLSADNDTAYMNKAKVTSISIDKLNTLKSNFNWERAKDETNLTITPPTGSDKSQTYWIAGAIGLIVLAAGIVFIKKKVLKK